MECRVDVVVAQIGLETGVFNVELKMCPTGPRLLEINARMGGYYLRDWINGE